MNTHRSHKKMKMFFRAEIPPKSRRQIKWSTLNWRSTNSIPRLFFSLPLLLLPWLSLSLHHFVSLGCLGETFGWSPSLSPALWSLLSLPLDQILLHLTNSPWKYCQSFDGSARRAENQSRLYQHQSWSFYQSFWLQHWHNVIVKGDFNTWNTFELLSSLVLQGKSI